MFELYKTIKTRRFKGDLTLWEYYVYRLYKKYVYPKLLTSKITAELQKAILILERTSNE